MKDPNAKLRKEVLRKFKNKNSNLKTKTAIEKCGDFHIQKIILSHKPSKKIILEIPNSSSDGRITKKTLDFFR